VLVVDASVLATPLAHDADDAEDAEDGNRARSRLRDEALATPDLVDLEVTSVLRGRLAGGHLSPRRAELALTDLAAPPLDRAPSSPRLIPRCWELRDNLTVYDAAYIALAEALAVPLLTADARIAKATGPHCPIEVLALARAGSCCSPARRCQCAGDSMRVSAYFAA
jgi:predicted nucleic acid-binding protein